MPVQVLYMSSFVETDRIQTTTNFILYRPVTLIQFFCSYVRLSFCLETVM